MILACHEDCAFLWSMQCRVVSIYRVWLQKILQSVLLSGTLCLSATSPFLCCVQIPVQKTGQEQNKCFFPLTLSGPAALTRRIHALSPFWHLLGEIQVSASELKAAVNAPLKDNGTGHLPRAHSTGRAWFRIISFQKWKRMLCIFYSDTETWKENFVFVEKPHCSSL